LSKYDINAIIDIKNNQGQTITTMAEFEKMANLVVRNIDDDIVKALKFKAGKHGISAEAAHRQILKEALLTLPKKTFAEILATMPNVGRDSDFNRMQDGKDSDVFT